MGLYKDRKIKQRRDKRRTEIIGLSFSIVSGLLFVLLCFPLGAFSDFFMGVFGVSSYPLFLVLGLFGVGIFLSSKYYLQKKYFMYLILNFIFLVCLLHTAIGSAELKNAKIEEFGSYLSNCFYSTPKITIGGVIFSIIIYPLVCLMGIVGTCIFFSILLVIFVGLSVDYLFFAKKKSPKQSRFRDVRTIDEQSTNSYINLSNISYDYDTRAKKIVPKKFEKEDFARYGSLQTNERGAEYFSNRLTGVENKSNFDTSQSIGSDIIYGSDEINNKVQTQETINNGGISARDLLFGKKEDIPTKNATPADEELYPSKYDPNIFSSKREYITTPILPDFLNRREINREMVLERNRKLMQERSEKDKIIDSNEPVDAFFRSNISQTDMHKPELELKNENVETQFNDIINSVNTNRVENFDNEIKRNINFSRDITSPINRNKPDDSRFNINDLKSEPNAGLTDFRFKSNFENDVDSINSVERRRVGVRGKDLSPRKSPDRTGFRPQLSDLVEDENKNIDSLTEQKKYGINASVVAPKPQFLAKTEPTIKESLINSPKPSFNAASGQRVDSKYVAPDPRLLTTLSDDPAKYGGDTKEKSRILEETLESFRINAKVSNVVRGPSVTRYELQIPAGIPVRKISNYESNIAMTLMSKNGIRLELPIPGKNAVGVEIPNDTPCTVGLRDMVMSREFQSASGALPVAIGKNISGEYVVRSMAKMVHLLVAGSTGSGKSVFLHNLILSLMFKSSPDQLRFIMIDPKRVEFIVYNGMPHMMLPNVVTECDKAINALSWATKEMDRRYRMFNQHLVNDIESFNKCPEVTSGQEQKIPYIVIVIDELADLMMIGQKEVERHIQRIAQLGRACGIHLVIATQRPTVQVVTGTIKANLPTRVAFSLTSVIDSKTILDEGGAEKLIGKGDMLFSPQGAPQPIRLQAAFATLDEVKSIVNFLKEHNSSYFDEEVEKQIMSAPEENNDSIQTSGGSDSVDEFFYPALRLFIETGTASTTMIQRRFGVGFARAARLVDQMEVKGYISPQNGSKKRNVYITMDQYREISGDID